MRTLRPASGVALTASLILVCVVVCRGDARVGASSAEVAKARSETANIGQSRPRVAVSKRAGVPLPVGAVPSEPLAEPPVGNRSEALEAQAFEAIVESLEPFVVLEDIDCSARPCLGTMVVERTPGDDENPALWLEALFRDGGWEASSAALALTDSEVGVVIAIRPTSSAPIPHDPGPTVDRQIERLAALKAQFERP